MPEGGVGVPTLPLQTHPLDPLPSLLCYVSEGGVGVPTLPPSN